MAEKRKARKKKEEVDDKPTKEEYAVAKYLRDHLPVKKTTLLSHKVEYFIASKAIDTLLDSQWSANRKGKDGIFTSRETVVEYLNMMLIHKFFHRAKKITVSQKELKAKKKSKNEREDESSHAEDTKEKKAVKRKDKEKDKGKEQEEKKDEKKESSADGSKDKKKEKRKIKLDMHLEQVFLDGNEAYVWIYDPIPTTAWLIGGLLVVGAILLCLFPLWPSSVRKGVYYISIAAAGFLCIIVALIFARIVIFSLIWVVSFGRHHLWILPNLTEDVGFFESFWPLYKYEYKGSEGSNEGQDEKEKHKKKKKAKDSDDEDSKDKKQGSETEKDNTERESDKEATDSDRESEDSREQNRRDSANGDNGFEMVTQDDVEREEDSGNNSKKHSGVMPITS